MQTAGKILVACSALTVTGCGQPLGEYKVDAISLVAEAPPPEGVRTSSYGQFLKIELSSDTSLTALSDEIDGVYAHADFCPFSDRYLLTTFGPFNSQDDDLGLPSVAEPLRRGSDGRFHYNIYIVPKHPMPNVAYSKSSSEREAYDIGASERDICLRFDAPGYNVIESKSAIIRIPHERVAALMSSEV